LIGRARAGQMGLELNQDEFPKEKLFSEEKKEG
jgi:hypothetical protein